KPPVAAEPAATRTAPVAFGLDSARAELYQGQLALTLDFNRPLVGTQAFDTLLSVTDAKGAPVEGSWSLDEDGATLRFPYMAADRTYALRIKGEIGRASWREGD